MKLSFLLGETSKGEQNIDMEPLFLNFGTTFYSKYINSIFKVSYCLLILFYLYESESYIYSMPPLLWDTSFTTFSLLNLHQIKNPMAILKSAHHVDSETSPTCLGTFSIKKKRSVKFHTSFDWEDPLIWSSFGWDIWG